MKTTIIVLLLILSISVSAQLNPKIAFDYFPNNYVVKIAAATSGATNYYGMFRVRVGADYSIKKLTVYFDQKVYMNKASGISFRPMQAEWYVGLRYSVTDKIKIGYEHLCIHPIEAYAVYHSKVYGGYDVISISYGY